MRRTHTSLWVLILLVVFAVVFLLFKVTTKLKSDNVIVDEAFDSMIERDLGLDSKDIRKQEDFNTVITGEYAKEAKEYRTLAEAEEDMGYYLGFHNLIESVPGYELVAMYNIGNNSWYQAIFQHEELNKYGILLVKTSKNVSRETLVSTYASSKYTVENELIQGVEVEFDSVEDKYVLASFSTKNGKNYSLFVSSGLTSDDMHLLVNELVGNLKIMGDWVD